MRHVEWIEQRTECREVWANVMVDHWLLVVVLPIVLLSELVIVWAHGHLDPIKHPPVLAATTELQTFSAPLYVVSVICMTIVAFSLVTSTEPLAISVCLLTIFALPSGLGLGLLALRLIWSPRVERGVFPVIINERSAAIFEGCWIVPFLFVSVCLTIVFRDSVSIGCLSGCLVRIGFVIVKSMTSASKRRGTLETKDGE